MAIIFNLPSSLHPTCCTNSSHRADPQKHLGPLAQPRPLRPHAEPTALLRVSRSSHLGKETLVREHDLGSGLDEHLLIGKDIPHARSSW